MCYSTGFTLLLRVLLYKFHVVAACVTLLVSRCCCVCCSTSFTLLLNIRGLQVPTELVLLSSVGLDELLVRLPRADSTVRPRSRSRRSSVSLSVGLWAEKRAPRPVGHIHVHACVCACLRGCLYIGVCLFVRVHVRKMRL